MISREIAKFCRDELSFDYLLDITSIDNFGEEPRFEIVYHLYSMPRAVHLRLKLKVSEKSARSIPFPTSWPTANWHEREAYDMMGIKFNGPSRSASYFNVGRLSVLPAAKRFSRSKDCRAKCPMSLSTKATPLEGGPFVTVPSTAGSKDREPRARPPEL